jgi:hypothetical protein
MRLYALLLGMVVTGVYGYAAQVAVASANPTRYAAASPIATLGAGEGGDQLWYGGVLDPITVESGRATAPPGLSRRLLPLEGSSPGCVPAGHRIREAVL